MHSSNTQCYIMCAAAAAVHSAEVNYSQCVRQQNMTSFIILRFSRALICNESPRYLPRAEDCSSSTDAELYRLDGIDERSVWHLLAGILDAADGGRERFVLRLCILFAVHQ